MFQFDSSSQANNTQTWLTLPGHVWGIFGEVKPNATVLVTANMKQEANALTLEEERRNAVMVHQHLGMGQVLWIGIDSTWRWRHRVGDKYHHQFWGQLGRWAAGNKFSAGNADVRFRLQKSEIKFGEDAVIQTRWASKFLADNPDVKAKVKIYKKTVDEKGNSQFEARPFSTLPLKSQGKDSMLSEARAISLPSGEYRVKLDYPNSPGNDGEIAATFYVQEQSTPELSELSANRTLLQELADKSQGRLFFPDTLAKLPQRLVPREFRDKQAETPTLWDTWPIMVLFFALLTIEWIVRKLNGLP